MRRQSKPQQISWRRMRRQPTSWRSGLSVRQTPLVSANELPSSAAKNHESIGSLDMLAARTKVVAIVACSSVVIIIVLAYIIVRNRFGSCYDSATGKVYNVDQKYLYLAHGDGVYEIGRAHV